MNSRTRLAFLLVFAIFASLFIYATELGSSATSERSQINYITKGDKLALINYSYYILDSNFKTNESLKNYLEPNISSNFDYDRLFITLYNKGILRACQSGSTPRGRENRIEEDVEDATIKCIRDKRYGGNLSVEEAPNVDLVFTFLFNRKPLENHNYIQLMKDIELGIHAIEIENNGKRAFFVESVPIKGNLNLKQTLVKLSSKAQIDRSDFLFNQTHIYIYNTLTFKGNRKKEINDLYRYNNLIDIKDINKSILLHSIALARNWYLNNTNQGTKLVEYEYYPVKDEYSKSDNHVRRLATLWAMAKISDFLKENSLKKEIDGNLNYYLNNISVYDGYHLVAIDGKAPLSYNAFLILAILNISDYPNKEMLVKQLANGILSNQKEDGSFYTDMILKTSDKSVDFFPGEALLALMQAYGYTKDPRYLDSAERAFIYYRGYWRNNKNTAFIPWHTQADYLLYNVTKDEEIPKFIFEMNDWLIENNQITSSKYPDEIGGMPYNNPGTSTSVYLEGINDAYSLAKIIGDKSHENMYKKSLMTGTRFILQTQYNEKNVFFTKNPDKAIGGFRSSLTKNNIRNDNVQHAVMALMKVYDNNIFGE